MIPVSAHSLTHWATILFLNKLEKEHVILYLIPNEHLFFSTFFTGQSPSSHLLLLLCFDIFSSKCTKNSTTGTKLYTSVPISLKYIHNYAIFSSIQVPGFDSIYFKKANICGTSLFFQQFDKLELS